MYKWKNIGQVMMIIRRRFTGRQCLHRRYKVRLQQILWQYYITNMPPGSYIINHQYLGYEDDSPEIQLGSDQKMQLDIKMKFKVIEGE